MDHVIIVGAGLSGIAMGIKLKQQRISADFTIYDRQSSIGGTWAQNTYPNLSCDVPSEVYSYSFYQKPDWTNEFATQPEILEYIHQCVDHFGLRKHIKLEQTCISAEWQEDKSCWIASFIDNQSGENYQVHGRFLVTAMGVVSDPKGIEDIPALRDFLGPIFHTSSWRDIDWFNKRVLVVGNGCSANQVIPWVLKEGKPRRLIQIVRSQHWIAPKQNRQRSRVWNWVCNYVPFVMKVHRLLTAWKMDQGFIAFQNSSPGARARLNICSVVKAYMAKTSNPRYHGLLLPKHQWGAKRPILDHGYLDATNDQHFELIESDGIRRVIDGRVIEDSAGNKHETDVVILANGFKTQELFTPVKIYGKDRQELTDVWKYDGGQEAYMGIAVHGFPNMFIVGGPNTLPAFHSTLHSLECSVTYTLRILQSIKRMRGAENRGGEPTIEITLAAQRRYMLMIQEKMSSLVYHSAVASYFVNEKSGRNTLSWPGSQREFWWTRCIQPIQWDDWEITS